MKKSILGMALLVAMMGALTGCGKEDVSDGQTTGDTEMVSENDTVESDTEKNSGEGDSEVENTGEGDSSTEVDVQSLADGILNGGDFKDNLATVDKTMALTRLYNLEESQIEAAAFYTNSNATAEEIAVIRTGSEDYVDTVKTAFETRISEQKEACRDYLPDEMPKLEDAVVYVNGNYVILCVSNDSGKAKSVIEGYFE